MTFGIVLDEHLVRDAERARNELDTLAQINLTRAAPVIADPSGWLADLAGQAGLGAAVRCARGEEPQDPALRARPHQLADRAARGPGSQELRDSPTLGFTTFLDTAQIRVLESKLEELRRARDQIQARIAFEGPPRELSAPSLLSLAYDDAGVQDRAKSLERIAREIEGTLFNITDEGSERINAEHERRVTELEALRDRDGSNALEVDHLIAQSAAVRDAQLSQLRAKEVEAADKVRATNDRVVANLEAERQALAQTEREGFVAQAMSRLSTEATAEQRREVERLAGALFEEQQALQVRQRLMDEGRSLVKRTRTATEQYAGGDRAAERAARGGCAGPGDPIPARWRMRMIGSCAPARPGAMVPHGSCRITWPRARMRRRRPSRPSARAFGGRRGRAGGPPEHRGIRKMWGPSRWKRNSATRRTYSREDARAQVTVDTTHAIG